MFGPIYSHLSQGLRAVCKILKGSGKQEENKMRNRHRVHMTAPSVHPLSPPLGVGITDIPPSGAQGSGLRRVRPQGNVVTSTPESPDLKPCSLPLCLGSRLLSPCVLPPGDVISTRYTFATNLLGLILDPAQKPRHYGPVKMKP